MSAIAIRPESPDDAAAIHAVIEAAFLGMPFADGDEQHLPARLREDGDLALSLVAEDAERIVGHIAFSPVTIAGGATGWYGLAPLSVLPELHGQGIGSALAKRGIADMQARGAHGLVVLGDPAYYSRFGFENDPALRYSGAPAEYFQCLSFEGSTPAGQVAFAPAFSGSRTD